MPTDIETASPTDRSSVWVWGFALFTTVLFAIALRPEKEAGGNVVASTAAGRPLTGERTGVATAFEPIAHAESGSGRAAAEEVPSRDASSGR